MGSRPLSWTGLGLLAAIVLAIPGEAQTTVDLGTSGNAAQWLISGAGATAAPAFQVGGGVSLTSTGFSAGTFVTGASLAMFNGFWLADNAFSIPAGATNISLSFSGLLADDRAVLELNGVTIGNVGISGLTGLPVTGAGKMRFTESGSDAPFTFTSTLSGVVTSGFNVGGSNVLRIIVNNTGSGLNGTTRSFLTGTDFTYGVVAATLTYTATSTSAAPVPILSSGALLAVAGLLLAVGVLALETRRRGWLDGRSNASHT